MKVARLLPAAEHRHTMMVAHVQDLIVPVECQRRIAAQVKGQMSKSKETSPTYQCYNQDLSECNFFFLRLKLCSHWVISNMVLEAGVGVNNEM